MHRCATSISITPIVTAGLSGSPMTYDQNIRTNVSAVSVLIGFFLSNACILWRNASSKQCTEQLTNNISLDSLM